MKILSHIWSGLLAAQFRKPSGLFGKMAADTMEERNRTPYEWLLQESGLNSNQRILEIGYGPGYGIAKVADIIANGSGVVSGLDFSKFMYKKASRRHRALIEAKKAFLACGDAAEMPFDERSFDRVSAANVTYFWPNPALQLREILRVLCPGGMTCIYFTGNESLKENPITRTGVFHFHERGDLTRAFESAGFSQVEYRDRHIEEGRSRLGHLVFATRPL